MAIKQLKITGSRAEEGEYSHGHEGRWVQAGMGSGVNECIHIFFSEVLFRTSSMRKIGFLIITRVIIDVCLNMIFHVT